MKFYRLLTIILLFSIPISTYAISSNGFSAVFVAASNQFASLKTPSGLPGGGTARTICAWIKTSTGAESAWSDTGTDAGTLAEWELTAATNQLIVRINGANTVWTATNITNGSWHNVCVTYPGGSVSIENSSGYMDGSALSQASHVAGIPNTNATCDQIASGAVSGTNCTTTAAPWNGSIDDERIWTRALSSTEISNLFSAPCTFNNGASFASWYQLENNFNDSQSTNNLTARNSPTFSSSDVPYSCTTARPKNLIPAFAF